MTGYTRADSVNNIADGNIINASDLDGEFDAVQAAFNSSTGHVHDGTAANGAPITKIGPTQDVVASATALTPKTTATVDVGSSALKFKDFFFSGTGTLVGLTATGAITLNTTTNNQSYTTTGAGTITISSGTAGSINNMTIGGTTPLAGAFTTLSTTGKITSGGNIQVVAAGDLTWGGNYGAGIPVINGTSGTGFTFYPNGSTSGSVAVLNASGLAITGSLSTTGSVGIGTSTISYKLTLQETSGSTFNREYVLRNGDQTNFWRMSQGRNLAATTSGIPTNAAFIVTENGGGYGASAGLALGTIESAPLLAITAGVERLRVLSTGEVGVGTSVPYSKLTVYGPTGIASATSGEATGVGSIRIENGSTALSSDGGLEFKIAGDTNGYGAKIQTLNSSGAQLVFANRTASATWVERMRIDSSGNVGIGNTVDNNTRVLTFNTVSGGSSSIQSITVGATNQALTFSTTFSTLQERMRIDGQGNVGIGTSTPKSLLDVNGGNISIVQSYGTYLANSYYNAGWKYTGNGFAWGIGNNFGGTTNGVTIAVTSVNAGGAGAALTWNPAFNLDSSGNVGIGTSSPTSGVKLDVNGTIKIGTGTSSSAGCIFTNANYGMLFQAYQASPAQADFSWLNSAGTERMRIDASGNVGIGVTPSAWGASYRVLEIGSNSYVNGLYVGLASNAYNNGTNWIYKTTNFASRYESNFNAGGIHAWFSAPSGTAGTTATFTESMRIDSSGNVGIGTTSPAYKLHVVGTSVVPAVVQSNQATTFLTYKDSATTDNPGVGSSGNNLVIYTTSTERMRIDSSGNLLVGGTSVTNTAKVGSYFNGSTTNGFVANDTSAAASTSYFICSSNGTLIGSIQRVGSTSAVAYNTTSDYRLKNVLGVVTGHGERIDALKPIDYQWKEGNAQARGFLAHEFQEVYANSVTGTKDAVDADGNPIHQSMQASSSEVIADLVAEIQSLRKRLTALEST